MSPASGPLPTAPSPAFRFGAIGRHSMTYAAGVLINKAIAFVMLPVYTRFLTPSDYGVLELVQMTFEVVTIFAGVSLVAGVFRFHAKAETEDEKAAVLATALLLIGATYSVMGAVTFVVANPVSSLLFRGTEYGRLIQIASGTMVAQGLLLVPFAHVRIRERSRLFVSVQVARLLVQLGLNMLFVVVLGMGVAGVLFSGLAANALFAVLMLVLFLRECPLVVSKRAAADLFRLGAPLVASRAATFISTFGDRYFLQAVGNTAVVGLYTLSYQFGFLLYHLVTTSFSMIWEPVRFEVAKRVDRNEISARAFVYFNLVLTTMAVGIATFVEPVLRIMAQPAFHSAAGIVPIVLLAYVLESWSSYHNVGLFVRERTDLLNIAQWVTTLIAVVGYVVLIPRWLGLGAAVATVVAFGFRAALVYQMSQRLWPLRYEWQPVLWTVVAGLGATIGAALLPHMPIGGSVAARTLVFGGYLLTAWYLPILSNADRVRLRVIVSSRRIAVARTLGLGARSWR